MSLRTGIRTPRTKGAARADNRGARHDNPVIAHTGIKEQLNGRQHDLKPPHWPSTAGRPQASHPARPRPLQHSTLTR